MTVIKDNVHEVAILGTNPLFHYLKCEPKQAIVHTAEMKPISLLIGKKMTHREENHKDIYITIHYHQALAY